jgi:hypothetical protein
MSGNPAPPAKPQPDALDALKKQAEDLKHRIEEAKKRSDMPVNSALGNPAWEQNAADGHLDRKDDDDDEK